MEANSEHKVQAVPQCPSTILFMAVFQQLYITPKALGSRTKAIASQAEKGVYVISVAASVMVISLAY